MLSTKASVGLFLIAGLVLFGTGLFLVGDRKKLFTRSFEVQTEFESVAGLEPGAAVRVAGLNAGEVKEIEVPPRGPDGVRKFRLHLRLDRKLRPLVRQDSVALIQTEGLVGNKYVEVDRGDAEAAECADPCTIPSKETFDFPDLMVEARGLISDTDATIQGAGDVAQNLNRVLGTFLARDANGKSGPANLNATVSSAQAAMTNLADSTEALKHNFFLRGFFNRRGFFNLSDMTVADYLDSDFVKKKAAKRVWLSADMLFTMPKKGNEELSPAGRKAIDAAVGAFAADLTNSPIMVEGYAETGTPDARFRLAQQRALLVQMYVQQQFQLKPKYVGAIPLVDNAPPKSGKDKWDGVALILLPAK